MLAIARLVKKDDVLGELFRRFQITCDHDPDGRRMQPGQLCDHGSACRRADAGNLKTFSDRRGHYSERSSSSIERKGRCDAGWPGRRRSAETLVMEKSEPLKAEVKSGSTKKKAHISQSTKPRRG